MLKKIVSKVAVCLLTISGVSLITIGVIKNSEISKFSYSEKYCNTYFNDGDLFHDQGAQYISDYEPSKDENVIIRLKVKHGSTKEASIRYTFDYNKTKPNYNNSKMEFEKVDDTGLYDYWIGVIPSNEAPYQYQFKLKNNVDEIYYNRDGIFVETPTSTAGDWSIIPDFNTPLWSQGATWYSIMPESYYNQNTINDKTGAEWDSVWGGHNSWAGEWFGGDLSGITSKNDYLSNTLNVTSLFLNPFWVTAHNAGYGCYDFFQIDSALGNDSELLSLVSSLHEDDLKIMLDAVFEYCNVNNILNNVTKMYPDLYTDEYYNFLQREESGAVIESVWGGALIDFSKQITRDYVYSSAESVMLSYIILFGIDAWRMDVGNTLSGTTPDNWETSSQILADIRPYLKEVSNEILFLSEHADSDQLTDGILDSKWNYAFNTALLDWCQNNSNAKILKTTLENAVLAYPRGVSNALYNFLTTHDNEYFYKLIDYDKTSFMTAQILLMTFVGAPCIYYGEETGIKATSLVDDGNKNHSFYTSMNWDESTYDYDIYNLTRSLTRLRLDFEDEYKNGAYMNLFSESQNNENDIFAYARFNDDTCITILNRNDKVIDNFTLNVSKLDLKDGTVLTDYLSNKQYVVKNQAVTLDLLPYGSILTTKGNNNSFINSLEYIKSEKNNSSIVAIDKNKYKLNGNNSLEDSVFAYKKGFNNYAINVKTNSIDSKGKYAVLIKDKNEMDASFYGVIIEKDLIQLVYKYDNKIVYKDKKNISTSNQISVVRDNDNTFKVLIDNIEIEEFSMRLDFDYQIYLGITPLSSSSTIEINIDKLKEQITSNFTHTLGSQFFVKGNENCVEIANDKLKMKSCKEATFALTQAHMQDLTIKSTLKLSNVENGFAGIVFLQDERDYIILGKHKNSIILGHVVNNQLAIYGQLIKNENDFTLQIEKVGTTYKGIIINADNSYVEVGKININYSNIYAGIVNNSLSNIEVESFGFGDFNDNLKDYKYVGKINFSSEEYVDSALTIQYQINGDGSFSYTNGGVLQTNIESTSSMYSLVNSVENYTSTFTFSPVEYKDENSYIGVSFDNSASNLIDAYQIRLYNDGKIKLLNSSLKILSESKIENFNFNENYTFSLRVIDNYIYLYGNDLKLLLSYDNRVSKKGYLSYNSHKATYKLLNYNTYKQSGNYGVYSGALFSNEKNGNVNLELSSSSSLNYAGIRNQGLNDFTLGFNLQLNRINTITRGYFHLNIGSNAGHYYMNGLVVRFDDRGRISIYEDGVEKIKNQETSIENITSVYLSITYKDKTLTIKSINYDESNNYNVSSYQTILTYNSGKQYNGALSFYSKNCGVKLNYIKGYGLSSLDDATTFDSYTDIKLEEPLPPNGEVSSEYATGIYKNTFDSNSSLSTLDRYSGQIMIEEGNLIVNGYTTINWDAGATITSGIYDNFKLKTRFKIGNDAISGGFVGVEFYKSSSSVNHQGSSLTTLVYPSGYVGLFIGNGVLSSYGVSGVFDDEGYLTLNLSVINDIISFDLGANSISIDITTLSNNSTLTQGYISLNAGANIGYFDYVEIEVI